MHTSRTVHAACHKKKIMLTERGPESRATTPDVKLRTVSLEEVTKLKCQISHSQAEFFTPRGSWFSRSGAHPEFGHCLASPKS